MQGLGVRVRGLAAVYPKLLIAEVAEKIRGGRGKRSALGTPSSLESISHRASSDIF